jgi:cell division protein FtsZ
MEEELLTLPLEGLTEDSIIKVIGVGGGGCNAVNYMHRQGLKDVTFLVCNTDRQVLIKSSVPSKLQLGPGLGAGGDPETARQYADESRDHIREALNDGTQMLFITAGMGGGTGTGASSVVAEVAQEMGILTVGIVTIPFAFEGKKKIEKAMTGVARLAKHVDALLIINNEKLKQIYPELNLLNAFSKSDDVVANAARAIAEIITVPGYINTDFADVRNTLRKGGVAIMNIGRASGEERITRAINDALNSPLVNTNDVHGAERILLQFYCSTEHAIVMEEIDQINDFVQEVGDDIEVQWGASIDESLGEDVRVTVIATGYKVDGLPSEEEEEGKKTISEAIEANYPPQQPKPLEDEKATLIDLSDTLRAEGISDPQPVRERPASPSAEEVVITVEEEIKSDEPKEEPRRSRFGWIRRK